MVANLKNHYISKDYLLQVSASVNLETFLEANSLRWLRNTGAGGLQARQAAGGIAKELLDLETTDVFSGDRVYLEAADLDDNNLVSEEESDNETSAVEEEDNDTERRRD